MGQSLTLQTAKEAHFANGKKPRVTVIDRRADPKRRIFYGRYPQFDKACRLSFVSEDAESLDVLERIKAWASDKNALTAVVISLDDDSRATLLALSILHHLADVRVPIFIRTAEVRSGQALKKILSRLSSNGVLEICHSRNRFKELYSGKVLSVRSWGW